MNIPWSTPNNNKILDAGFFVPLKHLSNFRRYLDFPLIKDEIELELSWSKECITFEILIIPRVPGNPDVIL